MNVPQKILIGSCTVLFMCSCLIAQAASHTVQTRLIAPLSDQKSLEQWFVRPSTELELVKWPDGTPGFCAKLTLHKYEGKGEQWPAIIRKENFILVKDWTNIRTLKFPIYVEEDGFLRIHFTTKGPGNAKGFAHNLKVRAGRNHMEIPAEILRAMPLKHITSIHFLLIRPKNTKVFYIGDVTADFEDPTTLVKALKLRTMAFSPADFYNLTKEKKDLALVTLEKFRELTGQLPDHGTLPDQKVVKQCQNLDKRLTELKHLSQFLNLNPGKNWTAGWATSTERIYQENQIFHESPAKTRIFHMASNEREGAQFLIYCQKDLRDLHVTVQMPEGCDIKATIHPVGYVWCTPPSLYQAIRTGWMPDPICDYASTVSLKKGHYQPFYLELKTPKDTRPGMYSGTVEVWNDFSNRKHYPFSVKVFDFSLPDGPPYPQALARGVTDLGKSFPKTDEERKRYAMLCMKMMTDHRLISDSIYRRTPPSVAEAKEISKGPKGSFCILYLDTKRPQKGKYPRKEKDKIMSLLAEAIPGYREAGILDKAYLYGFDEASQENSPSIKDLCLTIKRKYPSLPIMTTAYDESFGLQTGLDSVIDAWVPVTSQYEISTEAIRSARSRGKKIWWYIAIGPRTPYANVMIDGNDTIDARLLMGLMAQKFRPDGFLYYCVAMWRKYAKRPDGRFKIVSLREHPMSGAPRTNWLGYSWKDSNGDGNWFYPGEHAPVASLRLKNINDGLEDYHYWEMLRNAITQVRDGRSSMPEEWLKQADYALKGIDRLVSSLIHFTKRHRELEAERIRVGLLIEQFHTRR